MAATKVPGSIALTSDTGAITHTGAIAATAGSFTTSAFFFQAADGIRDIGVTGVQTCALPISRRDADRGNAPDLGDVPGDRAAVVGCRRRRGGCDGPGRRVRPDRGHGRADRRRTRPAAVHPRWRGAARRA